jgi:DNA-binding transcriptional MerR regulator
MSTPQIRGRLSITQLAARASVRPDTIRYYERTRLLPAPARTAGDHRSYDRPLDRLQFIRGAKRLGLRPDAIAELLDLRDAGQCPCDPAADMLRARLAEIDAEMTRLAGLCGQLAAGGKSADRVGDAAGDLGGFGWIGAGADGFSDHLVGQQGGVR